MPRKAGKSADGKGGNKAGYMMAGSKMAGSNLKRGGPPPKTMGGMMKSCKAGK